MKYLYELIFGYILISISCSIMLGVPFPNCFGWPVIVAGMIYISIVGW